MSRTNEGAAFLGRSRLWTRCMAWYRLLLSLWAFAGNGCGFVPSVAAFRALKES
jgi:hypothetical protein